MSNGMRFEVPQFIEIEDKIFGPFTWRQFVYLAGGLGIAIVTYITMPRLIFIIIGFPVAALAFVLAFYPVNNRPFSIFLESIFKFYRGNREYHWKRKADVVYRDRKTTPPSQVTSTPYENLTMGSDINSLSRKLELNALQKDN